MKASADAKPGDALGVDDEYMPSIGHFDQMISLVGNEHGALDDAERSGIAARPAEDELNVAFAVELFQCCSKLV